MSFYVWGIIHKNILDRLRWWDCSTEKGKKGREVRKEKEDEKEKLKRNRDGRE